MSEVLASPYQNLGRAASLGFTLEHWALWQAEPVVLGHAWPAGKILSRSGEAPDVGFLPMLQRRRLSPLARAACAVAWNCREVAGEMPAIFYSSHGESQFYLDMLQDMAAGEALSPSRFSLSVHNAIAGLYSLQSQSFLPYVALAGGVDGLYAAFVEAAGWLLEVPQVMVVCYEQPLPALYQTYVPSSSCLWALAMVLARGSACGYQLHLAREPIGAEYAPANGQPALLRAILNGQREGYEQLERVRWRWSLERAAKD